MDDTPLVSIVIPCLRERWHIRVALESIIAQDYPVDLMPERDIVIADDPGEFAQRTVDLLRDSERRLTLSQNGRKAVEAKYSWPQIVAGLELTYEETVSRRKRDSG